MNISYIGTESGFFEFESVFSRSPFFPGPASFITQSVSSNTVTLQSTGFLHSLVLQGTGFTADANGNLNGGTITSVSISEPFASPFETIVTFSEINWTVLEFLTASQTAFDFGDLEDLTALLNGQGPVTFDASEAVSGVHPAIILDLITEDLNFIGSAFSDIVTGGDGNDTINPGSSSEAGDISIASLGNDTYDFGLSVGQSIPLLSYKDFFGVDIVDGIDVVIDGTAGTGSVTAVSSGFTDTLINLDQALAYAFALSGTSGNDSYDISLGGASFAPGDQSGLAGSQLLFLLGREGTGSFDLHFDGGGFLELSLSIGSAVPTQGFVADISNGTITNDGHGNTESISVTGTGGTLAFGLTDFADSVIGNDMNNVFTPKQGDDTIDGGDGFDLVRYDIFGADVVTVDLSTGVASGIWNGSAFTDNLTNIEGVRGSRDEGDVLIGAAADEMFWGEGGNDSIAGGQGDDTLFGEADDDILEGGLGNDTIDGGDGIDTATYENATSGVTVKLAKNQAFGGDNVD
ncbi:MAG: hypothetical protein ABJ251_12065, partial [Paracoccaceae bacterium]